MLPERLPDLADGTKDVQDIERDRQYAQQKGTLHRQRRQEEYLDTLRKNLRNPHVKRIHLLLEKESDMGFIREQGVPDLCEKLRPVVLGRWMHYKDAFQYANTKLPGELCMIMNADIYLGEGFQHATHDVFDRKEKPHSTQLYPMRNPDGQADYYARGFRSLRTGAMGGSFRVLCGEGDLELRSTSEGGFLRCLPVQIASSPRRRGLECHRLSTKHLGR